MTHAAVGECNFDKYASGCYSQANFVCDPDTNSCRCHSATPVLIEQRICVKRAKLNDICQYNEQCDNANGLFCSYTNGKIVYDIHSLEDVRLLKESYPRCRKHDLKSRFKFEQQQINPQEPLQIHQYHSQRERNSNQQTSSSSPRYVWIFLLACLMGLILLLLLIETQYYKAGRSFHQQEDRISINSEQDIPPPYEVAIRMKL